MRREAKKRRAATDRAARERDRAFLAQVGRTAQAWLDLRRPPDCVIEKYHAPRFWKAGWRRAGEGWALRQSKGYGYDTDVALGVDGKLYRGNFDKGRKAFKVKNGPQDRPGSGYRYGDLSIGEIKAGAAGYEELFVGLPACEWARSSAPTT